MSEDPDKLIYIWTNHVAMPKWVDPKSSHTCFNCHEKQKLEHCRLCGQMFCTPCTGKYNIPEIYEKGHGNKKGPTRVCYGCVHTCMREKIRSEKGDGAADEYEKHKMLVFIPDSWEEKMENCPKCNKKGGTSHNCRCCGRQYCSTDCSKVEGIPSSFDKKGKTEKASRVCDECRFTVKGGGKFVEDTKSSWIAKGSIMPSDTPPVLQKGASQANLGSAMGMSAGAGGGVDGDDNQPEPSMMRQGSSAPSVLRSGTVMGGTGPNAANQKLQEVIITWEGQPKNILGRFQTPDTTNLVAIDNKFQKQLSVKDYVYIFRNEVIPKVFWDIFTARVLGTNVLIRPAEQKSVFDLQAVQVQQVSANNDPNYVSPYKRDANAKIIQEKKKEVNQELHRGKFRPLGRGAVHAAESKTSHFKETGSVPPGFDADAMAERQRVAEEQKKKENAEQKKSTPDLSKVAAGGTVEDLFKARAKALF